MCEQYRSDIEAILRKSDLSTITTKEIRHNLQNQLGISLDPVRKDLNTLIKRVFVEFESAQALKQEESSTDSPKQTRPDTIKKTTPNTIKKTTPNTIKKKTASTANKKKAKKDASVEKKPVNWPLVKASYPLSAIIETDICTRPEAVKKIWEYIKKNDMQNPKDKRTVICDDLLKQICGEDIVNVFTMNKYLKEFLTTIPKEEQETYKQIKQQREAIADN